MKLDGMTSFSLSVEELAMALAMINRPDLGQMILREIYDNLTTEQIDSRMTAASHSLLAHDYCGFTDELKPRLDSKLEQALVTLAIYDKTFQLSIVKDSRSLNANIHVKNGKAFTSHSVQAGIIHLLEHGVERLLDNYLLDILEDYGNDVKISIHPNLKISMGVLTKAQKLSESNGKSSDVLQIIEDSKIKDALFEDMVNQVSRVTLIRINANSRLSKDELVNAPKQALLLLKGKSRTWFFDFPSLNDDALATVELVTQKQFSDKLANFIK